MTAAKATPVDIGAGSECASFGPVEREPSGKRTIAGELEWHAGTGLYPVDVNSLMYAGAQSRRDLLKANIELSAARATIARVRALAKGWKDAPPVRGLTDVGAKWSCAEQLLAALDGPKDGGKP